MVDKELKTKFFNPCSSKLDEELEEEEEDNDEEDEELVFELIVLLLVEEDDEEGVVIEEDGEVLGEEEGVVGLQEVMNETAKRDVNRSLAFFIYNIFSFLWLFTVYAKFR